jgi:hypothetical protein
MPGHPVNSGTPAFGRLRFGISYRNQASLAGGEASADQCRCISDDCEIGLGEPFERPPPLVSD